MGSSGPSHRRSSREKIALQTVKQEPAKTTEPEETQALERALQETKKRFEAFISVAGHELRTPLTTIKGNAQLALRRLTKVQRQAEQQGSIDKETLATELERLRQPLDYIVYRVDMQDRMISDLLDVSRIQSGKLAIIMRPCNLRPIVENAVNNARQAAPGRSIQLALPDEALMSVVADAERIEQAIDVFISNAVKFAAPAQPIDVRLRVEDEQGRNVARLLVQDRGPGIPAAELEKIWEATYQVKGIPVQEGSHVGLGLGLFICRALIERQQGQVGVSSTPGEGSSFWFTLPLTQP